MQKAMKNTSAMILAGTLMVGGLLACTEETQIQEGEPQASVEQPSAVEESQSNTDTGSTMSPETMVEESASLQESPALDSEMSPSERAFAALDANEDSLLDENEVTVNATIHQDFEAIDLDKDGMLSINEFMVYAGEATAAGTQPVEPALDDAPSTIPAE